MPPLARAGGILHVDGTMQIFIKGRVGKRRDIDVEADNTIDWMKATIELITGIDAVEFARTVTDKGAGEILLTSMDRDGTRAGFNLPLTRAISDAVTVPVIASGGVGTLDHLVEGVTEGGACAVLAASIFHFGDFTIGEAKAHMAAAGIPVRLN